MWNLGRRRRSGSTWSPIFYQVPPWAECSQKLEGKRIHVRSSDIAFREQKGIKGGHGKEGEENNSLIQFFKINLEEVWMQCRLAEIFVPCWCYFYISNDKMSPDKSILLQCTTPASLWFPTRAFLLFKQAHKEGILYNSEITKKLKDCND